MSKQLSAACGHAPARDRIPLDRRLDQAPSVPPRADGGARHRTFVMPVVSEIPYVDPDAECAGEW